MKKENIKYQLLNYERNDKMLSRVPHIRYLDLAIVFYCELEEVGERGYGILTKKGMEALHMSVEELEALAAQNTPRALPFRLETLEEIVARLELLPRELVRKDRPFLPMYVLSNERRMFGSACILYPGLLHRISSYFGADLYILPSSIHECILMPANCGHPLDKLQAIVRDVNRSQVPEEEILSDSVYFYEKSGDSIRL